MLHFWYSFMHPYKHLTTFRGANLHEGLKCAPKRVQKVVGLHRVECTDSIWHVWVQTTRVVWEYKHGKQSASWAATSNPNWCWYKNILGANLSPYFFVYLKGVFLRPYTCIRNGKTNKQVNAYDLYACSQYMNFVYHVTIGISQNVEQGI